MPEVIVPPLDTLTPFIVNALPLAEVKARVPVELMLGVVTLVENVGLLTVPTVNVPPRDSAPPPVKLVPLLIVTELFVRAVLGMDVDCIFAPSRFVKLDPSPINEPAIAVPSIFKLPLCTVPGVSD